MTWEEAISYCEGLSLGGYDDWRLPSIRDLQSIVDYNRCNPASSYYWSSSTYAVFTNYAGCVDFNYGYVYNDHKSNTYYVRAVRGGGQNHELQNKQ